MRTYGTIALYLIFGFTVTALLNIGLHLPKVGEAPQTPNTPSFAAENCPQAPIVEQDLSFTHLTRAQGLPEDYVPPNLVEIDTARRTAGPVCVTEETARALRQMLADAQKDGITLEVFSGYRSPQTQASILERRQQVDAYADFAVAEPAHSEHQTGTAVDLTGASVKYIAAKNGFEKTPEYAWLSAYAWKYGFNLSYPPRNQAGPQEFRYEPWHWRYVGVPLAAQLQALHISYNQFPLGSSFVTGITSSAVQ